MRTRKLGWLNSKEELGSRFGAWEVTVRDPREMHPGASWECGKGTWYQGVRPMTCRLRGCRKSWLAERGEGEGVGYGWGTGGALEREIRKKCRQARWCRPLQGPVTILHLLGSKFCHVLIKQLSHVD